MHLRPRLTLATVAAALFSVAVASTQNVLPAAETIAPGIRLYRYDNATYFGDASPISARLLEIENRHATLDMELGNEGRQGRGTVPAIAARHGAIAAVNAGFFATNGDPSGVMKVDGLVVSDAGRPRGAVGFASPSGPPLLFDRLSIVPRVRVGGRPIALTGVDTARGANGAVLYTSRFGTDTRTTGAGWEYAFDSKGKLVSGRQEAASPIPAGGYVLSIAAGNRFAAGSLRPTSKLEVGFDYRTSHGSSAREWQRADDIVGGAGLLMLKRRAIVDWSPERLDVKGFVEMRHPRTVIGRDADGDTWLVVVDGRQPTHSVGMSLRELIDFASRIGIVDALNLDGGGSTTMVVKGQVVNRPSDATGPRPVSDAILVFSGRSNTRRD